MSTILNKFRSELTETKSTRRVVYVETVRVNGSGRISGSGSITLFRSDSDSDADFHVHPPSRLAGYVVVGTVIASVLKASICWMDARRGVHGDDYDAHPSGIVGFYPFPFAIARLRAARWGVGYGFYSHQARGLAC
jgi:hypothetical protein